MELTRRGFLKTTTIGTTIALGFDVTEARAEMRELKVARTKETRSTCPYCSVSCGLIVHTLGDGAKNATASVVHIEGDPDHPINRGTLCPKGVTPNARATLPGERCVTGSVATLPSLATLHRVKAPALIVIGTVVSLRAVLAPPARRVDAA